MTTPSSSSPAGGSIAAPAFELSEFRRRVDDVKRRMAEAGIEVLLVSDPANMNYLTGYDAPSYYTHQMAILALDADQPLWVGRKMDTACARYTAWLDEDNVIGYPERYIGVQEPHVMEFFAEVLQARGWANRRLGLEMDSAPLTPRCLQRLQALLPQASWADAELLVNRARLLKSAAEIAYIRQAAQIANRAMRAAFEAAEPGVRECDVAARVMAALVAGTPEFAGHLNMQGGFSMATGERTAAPHLQWTQAPLHAQQLISIELGGCRHAYHAGLTRSFFLGDPPAELRHCARTAIDGIGVALSKMRPGHTCGEVADAWNAVLAQAGLQKESRIGYSIGIGYPLPSWIDRSASLQSDDPTVLQPDMTFHLIIGMWMERWGCEFSETVRITEGAPEVLTDFPRELLTKP